MSVVPLVHVVVPILIQLLRIGSSSVFPPSKIQVFAHLIEHLILNELFGHCMQVLVNLISNAMKVNFGICALFFEVLCD